MSVATSVKLVIVGDGAVGKTCLLVRLIIYDTATLRTNFLGSINPLSLITQPPPSRSMNRWLIWDFGTPQAKKNLQSLDLWLIPIPIYS